MENKKKSLLKMPSCQDSIFVGLCSAALLGYSLYHHAYDKNTTDWQTSPYLFPVLISVFGLLLAISLFADGRQELRGTKTEEASGSQKDFKSTIVMIAAALVYYFLMPLIHFIPATLLFLLALFLYLGERKWWKLILLSGISTGAIYVMFGMLLHVRLP